MSKPFTMNDFSSQVNEDRTWRIREISDLKLATNRADPILQRVLLRSMIAICYAHWEGHVRFAAKTYLTHISIRKLRYSELSPQFTKNYFLPRLTSKNLGAKSLRERCEIIDDFFECSDRRYSRVNEDLINTRSNLNSEVIRDICIICDISNDYFEDHKTFIDVVILSRRNAIAHGEDTLIDINDLDEISQTSISLMRAFGDLLENRVYDQSYRAA